MGFLQDCVRWPNGEGWTPYQLEVAQALVDHRFVAARGTRGLGKTTTKAGLLHWFVLTREALGVDWKAVTTASIWRQLRLYLWPEVAKISHYLDWERIGRPEGPYNEGDELQGMAIKLKYGSANAVASREGGTIEGGHASELLLLFDEARIIPDSIWDSARGMLTSGNAYWLAQSTPGDQAGRFYDIFAKRRGWSDWYTRHITLDEARAAGRVSASWAEGMAASFDEGSPFYRRQVLGEFAADSVDALVPLAWVEQAQQRWEDWAARGWCDARGRELPVTCIAFDVGGGTLGGDASTIAIVRGGVVVERVETIQVAPDPMVATMHLAGVVKGLIDEYRPCWLFGDSIGIGAGVVARLREMGYNALPFVAGARTSLMDGTGFAGFENWRAAGWWTVRELLAPQGGGRAEALMMAALPSDEALVSDLTVIRDAGVNSRNQHRIEKKDAIRARIGRSTDSGDAVMMALAGPALYTMLQRDEAGGDTRVVYDPIQVEGY